MLQVEMSAYLKNELRVMSMVTNGNEGYRALGTYGEFCLLVTHATRQSSMYAVQFSTRDLRFQCVPVVEPMSYGFS